MSHGHCGLSNHQPQHCLLISLFKLTTKMNSKVCITGPMWVPCEFSLQRVSNTENVSMSLSHHDISSAYHSLMQRCIVFSFVLRNYMRYKTFMFPQTNLSPKKLRGLVMASYIWHSAKEGVPSYNTTSPADSSPPSAVWMHQWIGSALVQIMVCHLFSTKPLSKRILGNCQLHP